VKADPHEFTFGLDSNLVTPASLNYRLPSWPPPRDWPVVIDKDGKVVSRWGDPIWRLWPWHGRPLQLNFGDGKKGRAKRIDAANADLLRMVVTWLIWGPRPVKKAATVAFYFHTVKPIMELCSRDGIRADSLMRFPKVLERLRARLASSYYDKMIAFLHRLHDDRESLGFTLVDPGGLKLLVAAAPDGAPEQTVYIPPRIWLYQVGRLRECLTDFLTHRKQVEACFRFCLDAYAASYGSLEAALTSKKPDYKSPFNSASSERNGRIYQGRFSEAAARFGLAEPLSKWLGNDQEQGLGVKALSSYLSLVNLAGLAYIANFTLQRKEEVGSLRASCLHWEKDEQLGRVPIICGETTKTDPDSDARWVTSPSVEIAVEALSAITHLRMLCAKPNPAARPAAADQEDPYLLSAATEPWSSKSGRVMPYGIRSMVGSLGGVLKRFPLLLDREQMRITREDLKVALRLNPTLPEEKFAVGKVWPLAWHQYRRTGAVNMFASGDLSDSTMQQQMKHSSRLMPLYYGRNHTRLHLNQEVEAAVVRAMYEAMAERLTSALSDRFVSPHSNERKEALAVNVIGAKDLKDLVEMAEKGTVSFRENRLGGCMKAGACEYGGIESVARCAGSKDKKPCPEALFDRSKESQIRSDMRRVAAEIERLSVGSKRYEALVEERCAMENYLNVIARDG
jgi:hypothetical protein